MGLSQRPRPWFSRIETPAACVADPPGVRPERAGIVGMIDRKSEVLGARCAGDRLVSSLAERGSFKSCGTRRCGSRAAGGQLRHPRSLKPLVTVRSEIELNGEAKARAGTRTAAAKTRSVALRGHPKGTTAPIASQRRSRRGGERIREGAAQNFAAARKNHTRSFPRGASVPASSLPSRTAA